MIQKCRVLIAEDHKILREGLRALLASEGNIEVIAEVDNGIDALHQCVEQRPDVVIMDLSMPGSNGTEAIRNIKRRFPEIRVVVLTAHKVDEYVHAALEAGAEAYVLKDDSHSELLVAMRSVLTGDIFLSPSICGSVVRGYLQGGAKPSARSPFDRLTHREREVIKLVAEGYRNREIAEVMCLSTKTVEKHRANLMKKLSLHNATALTAFAFEHGLIQR
jgi:DNA-binding NarL/FixJ family response regulator